MREAVVNDMSDAVYDFMRLVWTEIAPWFPGGEFVSTESTAEKLLANDFDKYAGIDGYIRYPKKGVMQGLASRIQWEKFPDQWRGKPWNTFSLRKSRGTGTSTEIAKRLYALRHRDDEGYVYPHITLQAYISYGRRTGSLLSVAIAHTRQLIPYVWDKWNRCGNCREVCERRVMEDDGKFNTFLAEDWHHYKKTGLFIQMKPDSAPDMNLRLL